MDPDGSDRRFVFIISDCNLARYDLSPRELGSWLTKYKESVNAHVVMIASRGEEAATAVTDMPVGRAHLCLDTTRLPVIFKNVLSDELSSS